VEPAPPCGTLVRGKSSKRLWELLHERGPELEWKEAEAVLRREGLQANPETFRSHKYRLWPDLFPPVSATRQPPPVAEPGWVPPGGTGKAPVPPQAVDALHCYIRFAVVVEEVGGVDNARRLLDHFEQIQKVFRGDFDHQETAAPEVEAHPAG
jgi:hypothetical protein